MTENNVFILFEEIKSVLESIRTGVESYNPIL